MLREPISAGGYRAWYTPLPRPKEIPVLKLTLFRGKDVKLSFAPEPMSEVNVSVAGRVYLVNFLPQAMTDAEGVTIEAGWWLVQPNSFIQLPEESPLRPHLARLLPQEQAAMLPVRLDASFEQVFGREQSQVVCVPSTG